MSKRIVLGEVQIETVYKAVKNVHLTVHPPHGQVTLVAPTGTRPEVMRAYAISKLGWIRQQKAAFKAQARETPRQHVPRETHYLWGRRYLLRVIERDAKPQIQLCHKYITLQVRPGTSAAKRAAVVHEWHKAILHEALPPLIQKWEQKLGVSVSNYYLQRMKTQWGSCNPSARNIRINTEMVKKPKDLLEYVVAHEIAHLLEATHNDRFIAILDQHYPSWRIARLELNELPLAAEHQTARAQ